MKKIRYWAFPVTLIAAWMLVSAYTVSLMIEPARPAAPVAAEPAQPESVASDEPRS